MSGPRRGFTVFQLLVLLAVLAVLFAIFLPILVRARAQAARAAKLNNIKQICLATINYADTYSGVTPPGNDANNFGTAAYILPFLEQDNLYKQLDFKKPMTDPANAAVRKLMVPTYLSPNDPLRSVTEEFGATNYLFNAGTKASLEMNDGAFYQNSKLKYPASFTDGTSNTVLVGETLKGDGGKKALDVARQHVELGTEGLKDLEVEAGVQEFKDNKNIAGDRCASWLDGRFLQGTFNGGRQLNDPRPDVNCGGLGGWSALRSLDNQVSIGMCDGSARLIDAKKISLTTWRAALTSSGGEVLGNDFCQD
jgi:type II secretory pathway pseudopilin PulG